MNRLMSFPAKVVVVGLLLIALILVPASACGSAGPAGAAGPRGPAGPQGETVQASSGASLVASPTSVTLAGVNANLSKVTFTGAGFGAEEVVRIVIVVDAMNEDEQMVISDKTSKSGAFSINPTPQNLLQLEPGVYTIKAKGESTGIVATCCFTILPAPAK